MKQKILFLVHDVHGSSARSIRCRKICGRLAGEYEIHVINLTREPSNNKARFVHRLHNVFYGKLTKVLNPGTNIFVRDKKNKLKEKKKMNYFFRKFVALVAKTNVKKMFFPDRLIFDLFKLKREISKLVLKNDYKFVVSFVGPFSFLLIGSNIKRLKIKNFVDLGDPLTFNSAMQNGLIRNFLIDVYEKKTFKNIDTLIVTNNFTKQYYIEKYSSVFNENNIHIIPQGTDIPIQSTYIVKRCPKNLKFIYAGQFYEKLRDPQFLFKTFRKLSDKAVVLTIYGSISLRHFSDDILDNMTNIKFCGKITHEQLIKKYQINDVLVFIDNAFGIQQSGKIYELIVMKKPILFIYTNKKSESFNIIKGYKAVEYAFNDACSIEDAINRLIKNYQNYDYDYDYSQITWDYRAIVYKKALRTINI